MLASAFLPREYPGWNMAKRKVLFVASVPVHFHAFHRPYMKWFHDRGYEVHVACNGDFDDPCVSRAWNVPIQRSPWSLSHFSSCMKLRKIIEEQDYSLVTCHTPMASVIARISSQRARKTGTKVLYTAHGFHFFKGSGIVSWLLFYPVELILSYLTDAIICINEEDFNLIQRKGSRSAGYYLIPGIGVDSSRFRPVDDLTRHAIRKSFGVDGDDFVVVYAAEFIERKNHRLIVDVVRRLSPRMGELRVLLAGRGELLKEVQALVAREGLEEYFRFLGFVVDVQRCYQCADLAVSSSRQEGLGLNLVEAMMCGTSVVATIDRGHCTVVDSGINGYLVPQGDPAAFADAIYDLYVDQGKRRRLASGAMEKASKFEIEYSLSAMAAIYEKHMGGAENEVCG